MLCHKYGFSQPIISHPTHHSVSQHRTRYITQLVQSNSANPILTKVDINQITVEMEVDTGVSLSLINKATYDLISSPRQHSGHMFC